MNTILALLCLLLPLVSQAAVELASFAAISGDQQVQLEWVTASESNNDHFEVVRDSTLAVEVPGCGNTPTGCSYIWIDSGLVNGVQYVYTLIAVDFDGDHDTLGTVSATPMAESVPQSDHPTPAAYPLSAYPNPFNPSTTISFSLPRASNVTLAVYDITGRKVEMLMDKNMNVGEHHMDFDGSALPSGLYFARLTAGDFSQTQKMVLLK